MSTRPLDALEQLLLEDPWAIVDDGASGDDDAGVGDTSTYAERWHAAVADGSAQATLMCRLDAARKADRRARRLAGPPLPPDHPARMLADTERVANPELPAAARRSPLDAVALARAARIVAGRSRLPADELTTMDREQPGAGAFAMVAAAADLGTQVSLVRAGHADAATLDAMVEHAKIVGVWSELLAVRSAVRWGSGDVTVVLEALLKAIVLAAANWVAQLVLREMQRTERAAAAALVDLAALMPEPTRDHDHDDREPAGRRAHDDEPPERVPRLVDQLTGTLLVSPGAPQGHTTGDPILRVPPVVLAA